MHEVGHRIPVVDRKCYPWGEIEAYCVQFGYRMPDGAPIRRLDDIVQFLRGVRATRNTRNQFQLAALVQGQRRRLSVEETAAEVNHLDAFQYFHERLVRVCLQLSRLSSNLPGDPRAISDQQFYAMMELFHFEHRTRCLQSPTTKPIRGA